jgi:SAM-dependent methyltransferase
VKVDDFIYDIRWEQDETEWRARARRELALSLWRRYSPVDKETKSGAMLLDLGCGTGVLLRDFKPFGRAFGADINAKAVAYCRERGLETTVVADAAYPSFAAATFDLITAIEVLEHVEQDVDALNEIWRLLKPGGILILTVPAFPFLWSERDEKLHHKRRYTKRGLKNKIASAGFHLLCCSYIDLFLFLPLCAIIAAMYMFRRAVRFQAYEVSVSEPLNSILLFISRLERQFYIRFNLPAGVSLVGVAWKGAFKSVIR